MAERDPIFFFNTYTIYYGKKILNFTSVSGVGDGVIELRDPFLEP